MGSFPQDGENEQNLSYFFSSLELYCDQTVLFFQVFSIVLKRLCPLDPKNTSYIHIFQSKNESDQFLLVVVSPVRPP